MSPSDSKYGQGQRNSDYSFKFGLVEQCQSVTLDILPPDTKPNSFSPPSTQPEVAPSPFKKYAPHTAAVLSAISAPRTAEEQLHLLYMFCISFRKAMRHVPEYKGLDICGVISNGPSSLEARVERSTRQLKNLLLKTDRLWKARLGAATRAGLKVEEMKICVKTVNRVVVQLMKRLNALDTEWRQRDI